MNARVWYYVRIGIINFITGALKAIKLMQWFWVKFSYNLYQTLYDSVVNTINFAAAAAHVTTKVYELDPRQCLQHLVPVMMEYAYSSLTKLLNPELVWQEATSTEQSCELGCWTLLFAGGVRGKFGWCPFTNPQVYRRAARAARGPLVDLLSQVAGIIGAMLGYSAYVVLMETAYYLTLLERAYFARAAAMMWAYINTGQDPRRDPPPHIRSVENFAHQQTLDAFQEFVKAFNELLDEYGGGHIPTYPGPPLVAIQGFELDCPDLQEVAEYFGENFRETVRNWLKQRIHRVLGRY